MPIALLFHCFPPPFPPRIGAETALDSLPHDGYTCGMVTRKRTGLWAIAWETILGYNHAMPIDNVIIKPTTDLFIAALWSDPKNEPILRSLLDGVMTDIGQPAITEATVLNPFNIVRLMYSRQDQWREDALLIMFERNGGRLTDHRTYGVS